MAEQAAVSAEEKKEWRERQAAARGMSAEDVGELLEDSKLNDVIPPLPETDRLTLSNGDVVEIEEPTMKHVRKLAAAYARRMMKAHSSVPELPKGATDEERKAREQELTEQVSGEVFEGMFDAMICLCTVNGKPGTPAWYDSLKDDEGMRVFQAVNRLADLPRLMRRVATVSSELTARANLTTVTR